jgi:hypothetical protein
VSFRNWIYVLALVIPLLGSPALVGADRSRSKEATSFGTLKAPSLEAARSQALDWLKSAGKTDAATLQEFDALWSQTDRSVLDLVTATFALGDPEAAKLLAEARDPQAPAPTKVPDMLKDPKRSQFFKANLGLAYAKALSNRRVFEETLEVLRTVKTDQTVDPASYFFHRAVAEHAMLLKNDANRSITGLLQDVADGDAPERYKMVGVLMFYDMQGWRDKDLGAIARKMDNIERRLELARGGPETQKIQKDVVARLDEIIKELENQANGSCNGNGGNCPNGGQPGNGGGANPSSPMQDSNIATNGGPGIVDAKKLRGLAQQWGTLPPKERAKALQDLIRDMPPRHREITENYFRKLAQSQSSQP